MRHRLHNLRVDGDLAVSIVIVVIVYFAFALTDSRFMNSGGIYTVLEGFAFVGAIGLGVGVTMIAGEFDLSITSVAAVCGVFAVQFIDLGLVPAIALAVAIAFAFGLLQGTFIAVLGISSLLVTVGTMVGLRGMAYIVSDERAAILPVELLTYSDSVQQRIAGVFSPFSLITIALFVIVGLFMAYSRWGREIYAIGGGREEAVSAGVSRIRPLVICFGVSAALGGFAGAMLAVKSGSGSPAAYDELLLVGVTAALIGGVRLEGGRGYVIGIAAGAIALRLLETKIAFAGQPSYIATLAIGALLMLVLLLQVASDRPDVRVWLRGVVPRQLRPRPLPSETSTE
jgi:ribose transport system permease protein